MRSLYRIHSGAISRTILPSRPGELKLVHRFDATSAAATLHNIHYPVLAYRKKPLPAPLTAAILSQRGAIQFKAAAPLISDNPRFRFSLGLKSQHRLARTILAHYRYVEGQLI
jgi:hypothetical protein